jgi:hypothetical protein
MKELKLAYKELELDGFFPDLLKTLGKKIASKDPVFARTFEGDKKLSYQEQKAIDDDLENFFDSMNKTDMALRDVGSDNRENQSIFSNTADNSA